MRISYMNMIIQACPSLNRGIAWVSNFKLTLLCELIYLTFSNDASLANVIYLIKRGPTVVYLVVDGLQRFSTESSVDRLKKEMPSYQHCDSHNKDKTVFLSL